MIDGDVCGELNRGSCDVGASEGLRSSTPGLAELMEGDFTGKSIKKGHLGK